VKLRWASFRASPWIIMKRCYSLPLLELQGELNKGHLVHDEKGLLMPPYGSNWFDNEGNFTDDGDRDGFSAWKHPGDDRYSYCLRDVRVSYCLREEPIFVGEVSIHGSKPRVIQLTAIEPEWLKYHPVGFSNEYNSLRLDGTWNGEVAPEDVVPIQVYGVHQRLYFKVPRDHWREKLVFELGSPYWLREIMKSFETTYKIDCLFLFDRLREAL